MGEEGNRGVLDILDAESEILYRQTVLTRAIDQELASRFAENARTEGRSEGYEQARLEFLQSQSFKIGRAITAIPRKMLGGSCPTTLRIERFWMRDARISLAFFRWRVAAVQE